MASLGGRPTDVEIALATVLHAPPFYEPFAESRRDDRETAARLMKFSVNLRRVSARNLRIRLATCIRRPDQNLS